MDQTVIIGAYPTVTLSIKPCTNQVSTSMGNLLSMQSNVMGSFVAYFA